MPEQTSTVSCPHCGQTYAVTPEQRAQYGGRPITCTRCQRTFTADGMPAQGGMAPAPLAGEGAGDYPAAGQQVAYGPAGAYGPTTPSEGTSAWAVTSLVLGCLSFCIPIVAPIGAVVTGIVALARAGRPGVGGRGLAVAGISLGVVGFLVSTLLVSILLPSLNRAREQANRIKCASNLRLIGMSVQVYASANGGKLPDTLEQLVASGELAPDALVCPTSNDTIAPGATPQAQAASLATPGHLSYVYLGKGLDHRANADVIIAYEPPSNHRNDGMNVLYADGHVEFKGKNVAGNIISELEAGQNPPPSGAPGM